MVNNANATLLLQLEGTIDVDYTAEHECNDVRDRLGLLKGGGSNYRFGTAWNSVTTG